MFQFILIPKVTKNLILNFNDVVNGKILSYFINTVVFNHKK